MSTLYAFEGATNPNTSLPLARPSAADMAAWAYFDSLADTRRAVWLEASMPQYALGMTPAGLIAGAYLLDRCGRRLLTPHPGQLRHPHIVTDSITGRPVLAFGAGGSSPNALDSNNNGAMACASVLDVSGVETNNTPIFATGTGLSVAFKTRIPVPSTTANGLAFGTFTGGNLLGSYTEVSSTDAVIAGFNGSTGLINFRTRESSGSSIAGAADRRDGAWHDYMIVYDDTGNTINLYEDGVAVTPVTGATIDFSTAAGVEKLLIGGIGNSGTVGGRFVGFAAFIGILQGPVLADATARTALRNLMATR